MDIFQQWLLLRIQERFGTGTNPMDHEISFEAIVTLIKPIFEQEDAPLDESEIRRNLEVLVGLGYLASTTDDIYSLTFRAVVYSQVSTSLTPLVKDEFGQYVSDNWWKFMSIAILLVVMVSAITSVITVNIILR